MKVLLILVLPVAFLSACNATYDRDYSAQGNAGKKVKVIRSDNAYQLISNDTLMYLKGGGGYEHYDKLRMAGGNVVRIWDSDYAGWFLDSAQEHGLKVIIGLDIGMERLGFDYNDPVMVRKQEKWVREHVMKYKDHPALLMWGIGNEIAPKGTNERSWEAINNLAAMIHEIDPDHPTTTMIEQQQSQIHKVRTKCPEIDVLSINAFAALPELIGQINHPLLGWNGPYIISEWSSSGWWEVPKTEWYAGVEETSTEKAGLIAHNYRHILEDSANCLGSFIFYWGQKQERTPTWFSLFVEARKTESVEVIEQYWKNEPPKNYVPRVFKMTVDGKCGDENIYLEIGKSYEAMVETMDPDNDSLYIWWEVMVESIDKNNSGFPESTPNKMEGLISQQNRSVTHFQAPDREGAFRLFVYVYDYHQHVGTANIPFYVLPE